MPAELIIAPEAQQTAETCLFNQNRKVFLLKKLSKLKRLTKYKILTVYCRCGQKLVKYKKGPGRRLLKIHRDRITEDYTGIFINDYSETGTDIHCPSCDKRIATVQVVKGKYVNKVNQGQLGLTR